MLYTTNDIQPLKKQKLPKKFPHSICTNLLYCLPEVLPWLALIGLLASLEPALALPLPLPLDTVIFSPLLALFWEG